MKTLEFSISIATSKQKVWDTMLHPHTYQEWIAGSWPDSFYEGQWKKGEHVRFISADGSGTLVLIKELERYGYILCEHIAILNPGGVQDTTSKLAKNWIGITERYSFKEANGKTNLYIEISTHSDWEKMFNEGWPNALVKLKEVSERN
jgi:uncharacterized protein YndB with AHSA1/START domain